MDQQQSMIWRVSRLYPPNFTGAGIQAQREDMQFIKGGMMVRVLTAGISATRSRRNKTVTMDGIVITFLPIISYPMWLNAVKTKSIYKLFYFIFDLLSSLSFALGCAWRLGISSSRGDFVIFETMETFLIIPVWVARLKGDLIIFRMSLLGADDPYSRLVRAGKGQIFEHLKLRVYRDVNVVIGICTALIQSCEQAGVRKGKVSYIPYGIDTTRYTLIDGTSKADMRGKLGLSPDKKYIAFVGSAIERKGIDVMVDAFIAVRQNVQDVELLIVGPAEFDPRLHYNVRELTALVETCRSKLTDARLDASVHWIGQVENVHEYMQAADIFCLPTRREGFGLVIAEAMACELPVVVARLEGVTTDIIASESEGILIPGYSHRDYAEAIIELLTHPDQAAHMGQAARRRVLADFSLNGAMEKWLELFQGLSGALD
jgi:glycosyltransferase involved in cell wall biosynthesis